MIKVKDVKILNRSSLRIKLEDERIINGKGELTLTPAFYVDIDTLKFGNGHELNKEEVQELNSGVIEKNKLENWEVQIYFD